MKDHMDKVPVPELKKGFFEPFGPDMAVCLNINQLDIDANVVADLADSAFHYVLRAQELAKRLGEADQQLTDTA